MFIEGQEILDKRYRVIKKLGGGAFGEIYKGNKNTFENTSLFVLVEKKKSNELLAAKVVSHLTLVGGR